MVGLKKIFRSPAKATGPSRPHGGVHFDPAVHELLGTEVIVLSLVRIENTHESTYQTSS